MDSFYSARTCHPNPIKQQPGIFLFASAKKPNSYNAIAVKEFVCTILCHKGENIRKTHETLLHGRHYSRCRKSGW